MQEQQEKGIARGNLHLYVRVIASWSEWDGMNGEDRDGNGDWLSCLNGWLDEVSEWFGLCPRGWHYYPIMESWGCLPYWMDTVDVYVDLVSGCAVGCRELECDGHLRWGVRKERRSRVRGGREGKEEITTMNWDHWWRSELILWPRRASPMRKGGVQWISQALEKRVWYWWLRSPRLWA